MNAQTPVQRGNLIDLNITASPQLEHATIEPQQPPQDVLSIWASYPPAPPDNAILMRLGGFTGVCRIVPDDFTLHGKDVQDWLVLPLHDAHKRLTGLAYISPDPTGKPIYCSDKPNDNGYHPQGGVLLNMDNIAHGQPVHVVSDPTAGFMLASAGWAVVVSLTPEQWRGANPKDHAMNLFLQANLWDAAGHAVIVPVEAKDLKKYQDWMNTTGATVVGVHGISGATMHEPHELADLIKAATPEIKPPKNNGFGLVHISDLLSDIRPTDWLIHGFFESDSMSLLFGDPAAGKSFVAIDLAACIATGKDWHGHKTKQGAVIYIAGEGMNGISKRFKAWSMHNNTELHNAPLFVSKRSAQLSDEALAKEAADVVSGICSEHSITPALIVIDTLARNFGAADENSTRDMNAFISNVDSLLRIPYNACVLIVHHAGHGDKNRGRGSSALKGALDAEYSVTKQNRTSPIEGEIQTISLHSTKMKDAAPPQPKAFDLVPVHIKTCEVTWEDIGSAALSISDYDPLKQQDITAGIKGASNTALDCLKALYTEHITKLINQGYPPADARVTLESWRDRFKGSAECFGKPDDTVRKSFHRAKKSLSEKSVVSLSGEFADLSQDLISQIIDEVQRDI
ncbi:MAG: helicase RepA family protein [Flavobacteriales bacterium]